MSSKISLLLVLLLTGCASEVPAYRCVRWHTETRASYPFLAFMGSNPALALTPVFEQVNVCDEWVKNENANRDGTVR